MNEKIKLVFICIFVSVLVFGSGFLLGRGCSEARVDEALRIAEQERELAAGLAIDLSGTEKYNQELEQYIAELESDNRKNIKDVEELKRQNEKLRRQIEYSAELDRLTRESLERLSKAIFGN